MVAASVKKHGFLLNYGTNWCADFNSDLWLGFLCFIVALNVNRTFVHKETIQSKQNMTNLVLFIQSCSHSFCFWYSIKSHRQSCLFDHLQYMASDMQTRQRQRSFCHHVIAAAEQFNGHIECKVGVKLDFSCFKSFTGS